MTASEIEGSDQGTDGLASSLLYYDATGKQDHSAASVIADLLVEMRRVDCVFKPVVRWSGERNFDRLAGSPKAPKPQRGQALRIPKDEFVLRKLYCRG